MNIPQVRRDPLKWQQRINSPRRVQDYLTIFLFLLPAFVIFLLFIIYPIFRAVYFSLFNWNGLGPATVFVGLNNFKQILTDQVFMKASCELSLDRDALSRHPAAFGPDAGHHGGT